MIRLDLESPSFIVKNGAVGDGVTLWNLSVVWTTLLDALLRRRLPDWLQVRAEEGCRLFTQSTLSIRKEGKLA
jgi:hypothetical protein